MRSSDLYVYKQEMIMQLLDRLFDFCGCKEGNPLLKGSNS